MGKEKKVKNANSNSAKKKNGVVKNISNNDVKKQNNNHIEKNTKIITENYKEKNQSINENNCANKIKSNKILTNDTDFTKYIKIILIITVILLLLYFVTYFFVNKDGNKDKNEESNTTANIQYEEILASKMLTQKSKEYYVYIYEEDDTYATTYETYLSLYKYGEKSKKVFRVNLNSDFNKFITSKENKHSVSNIKDFKTNGTTILKISNGKIVKAVQGKNDILKFLQELSK